MLGNYLIRGLMIGLIFGVPAGAIGALTIQRTLSNGFYAGLVTGLGPPRRICCTPAWAYSA